MEIKLVLLGVARGVEIEKINPMMLVVGAKNDRVWNRSEIFDKK